MRFTQAMRSYILGDVNSHCANILALSSLLNIIGTGAFTSITVVFLLQSAQLSAHELGSGLALSGIVALGASSQAPRLIHRIGARRSLLAVTAISGAAAISYIAVRGTVSLVLIATVAIAAQRAGAVCRLVIISREFSNEQRVAIRAQLQVAANLGFGLGALIGAGALTLASIEAYNAVITFNMLTYAAAWILLRGLPGDTADGAQSRRLALHDRTFLLVSVCGAASAMHNAILPTAIPFWLAKHAGLPKPLAAVMLILNTTMVLLLQVRVARNVDSLSAARMTHRRVGLLLALACGMISLAEGSGSLAIGILLISGVVYTWAEMCQSSAAWRIAFDLIPPDSAPAYHATYSTITSLGTMIAPAVVVFVLEASGSWGWPILGLMFASACWLTGVVAGQ
ncbi:MFS transporter [Streptomyces sp. NPDC004787]|uniref:MFS transporter n=1 Tax=Streptomyces sp. NPDC004787 TaxID=3154291 RepID=UPI0033B55489